MENSIANSIANSIENRSKDSANIEKEARKQKICELVAAEFYRPMKEKELAAFLQVDKAERGELSELLQELVLQGRLMLTPRGKYVRGDGSILTGTFIGHAKGFGFVQVEGREEDLFIPEDRTGDAFHGDIVQVQLLSGGDSTGRASARGGHGRRQEARVLRVLQRGITTLVGTYEQTKNRYGFVVPDNGKFPCDIFIPAECAKGAVTGHKVVVEITDYRFVDYRSVDYRSVDCGNAGYGSADYRFGPDGAREGLSSGGRRNPQGRVTEILGHINDPGVDILSIVKAYELPVEFPGRVLQQAEKAAGAVTEADCAGRRDLRDVRMVTIDGEDAKDLDDAVSVTFDGHFYHLGVHIADVANYVQEHSALDREALKRGTSVYLTDRVIPMLPHVLSNGICSLNAGEDRLALSCLMTIDGTGEIVDYEIFESVVRVDRRMTYTAVRILLESAESGMESSENRSEAGRLRAEYEDFLPMFEQMARLAKLLRAKRQKRGSIDFDFPECKILLDQEGRPLEIKPYERNVATDLIEDFMLAANETVAQHFYWMELPFLYRVHDVPDAEKIRSLSLLIHNFGYYMKSMDKRGGKAGSGEVHPKEIQKLLEKIAGTPEEPMIARLALRSMKQAKYSVVNSGHFGLACKHYCHFTSPIRRYPDLQIHRIIKDQLRGRMSGERAAHYRDILPGVAEASSKLERRADEAERETDKLKKVEYMEARIGEEFDGVVSGVTSWGIYVELPNTVEGLVHVSKLPGDYFSYHEREYEMVGESTGQVYKLGMPLRVRVAGCDRFNRTIDFEPVIRRNGRNHGKDRDGETDRQQ
ncbi:MAG: ribonuclease R [Muribaculum sp.]|nr:ribonuclease R [Muribaculum sp.]